MIRLMPLIMIGLALAGARGSFAAPGPGHAVHRVTLNLTQFDPGSLELKRGDTVVWENQDIIPHTVTSEEKKFDSGPILQGKSWKYVAKRKGTFHYFCRFHPTMKGTLVVK